MATSAIENRLLDLLVLWDELHRQGRDMTAEELCSDGPELVGELRGRIEALRGIDPVLDLGATAFLSTPGDSGSSSAVDCKVPDLMQRLGNLPAPATPRARRTGRSARRQTRGVGPAGCD